ncbi:hypothetical protein [Aliivibrio logei]|uniref:hypothetical protein n=1 Tax=Aliivibrio logei TaxID=688 RepID=UPI0035C8E5DF
MDTKIRFRVNDKAKLLSHEQYLIEQVNLALDKLDSGKANFINHNEAKETMAERKTRIRGQR